MTKDLNLNAYILQSQFGPTVPSVPQPNVPAGPTVPTAPVVQYTPTSGWDTGKLNDPTHQTPKYQFLRAMQQAKLDPVAVQGHGQTIVDAINKYNPGVKSWVDPNTDAVMWPGLGPIDVTVDSGKKGWSFRESKDDLTPADDPATNLPYANQPAPRTLYTGMTAQDPNALFQQLMQQVMTQQVPVSGVAGPRPGVQRTSDRSY